MKKDDRLPEEHSCTKSVVRRETSFSDRANTHVQTRLNLQQQYRISSSSPVGHLLVWPEYFSYLERYFRFAWHTEVVRALR